MFSVVIPIHNKLPHLDRSILSVLNQTYQNFEILLIDDASTDGSFQKIEEFDDPRIRIFRRNTPGPGGYAARNLGIKEAKGEWIAFLDADDEWYPEHLERMNELSKRFPEVYFMSCGWETEKKGKKSENGYLKFFKYKENERIYLEDYLKFGIKGILPVWTGVACIKKTSQMALDLFPASSGAKRGGDLYAWLKLMCYHKKMAWSNHLGGIYHTESINMVTKTSPSSFILTETAAYEELSKNLGANERKWVKRYLNQQIMIIWSSPNLIPASKNIKEALYWDGNFFNALKNYSFSFLPPIIFRRILGLKRRVFALRTSLNDGK